MDNKEAKKNLQELKESLEKVLGDDGLQEEAQEHAKAAKQGAKTLIGRLKELPVVEKISSLGTAGTVAVGTAAATQAELAVNYTEIVVAQVAEDVWEGVIEPPFLFDMIDYEALHIWGQEVIAEKVAEVSELQSTSQPSPETTDTKPSPSSFHKILLPISLLRVNPLNQAKNQKQRSQKQKKVNHLVVTKNTKSDSQEEPKEETKQDTPSEESKAEPQSDVKSELPIIETPFEQMGDNIKPHSSIRHVSPTN